ncbi:uncharacterized protein DNG_04259 [Cephalotrichum gorgonifer]|uniref:Uncharacterized protein n=1 Tax=Cephalotrichum gorgonifer TaxID=2041049 RepID=A0AAE8MYJ3_9PEZI|nr:uncharacterized protein DNG_04259 [Cephalotrichum gorgonifer]
MRLPTAPLRSRNAHLTGNIIHSRDDEPGTDSAIVELPGVSVALILVITFLVLIGLFTILLTTYCVLSRRYAARAAAGAPSFPSPSPSTGREDLTKERKSASRIKDGLTGNKAEGRKEERKTRSGKVKENKASTVILYQHEPEVHGYFAPLYCAGKEPRRAEYLEDVKTMASSLFESGMLGRARDEKGEKRKTATRE